MSDTRPYLWAHVLQGQDTGAGAVKVVCAPEYDRAVTRLHALEAALREVETWADGACPLFDKGRIANLALYPASETPAKSLTVGNAVYMESASTGEAK